MGAMLMVLMDSGRISAVDRQKEKAAVLQWTMPSLAGEDIDLAQYQGHVLLTAWPRGALSPMTAHRKVEVRT